MKNLPYTHREREEFANFKRWLFSLEVHDLLDAMKFHFKSAPTEGGSHEYDILVEMVKLENPPSTPVHPRAMGYSPRMSKESTSLGHSRDDKRRTHPQLFQWLKRESYPLRGRKGNDRTAMKKFDVIARRKVAPWGEVYSIGCTREQQEADQQLTEGSYICRSRGKECSFLVVFHGLNTTTEILRMLQVASRGHFLNPPHRPGSKISIPFCADWLQPTQRWFSLSLYLASRYHVALWETFKAKKEMENHREIDYEQSLLERAVPLACKAVLQQVMSQDISTLKTLRDSLTWGILFNEHTCIAHKYSAALDWKKVWTSLIHLPLRSLKSEQIQLFQLVTRELDFAISNEIQKSILQDLADNFQSTSLKSKRKRKKKKQKKRRGVTSTTIAEEIDEEPDMIESSGQVHHTKRFAFPRNEIPRLERNRNIVFALTILEEVIEASFVKVGFQPAIHSEEENPHQFKHDGIEDARSTSKFEENNSDDTRLSQDGVMDTRAKEISPVPYRLPPSSIFPPSPFSANHFSEIPWPSPSPGAQSSAFEAFVPSSMVGLPSNFYHPATTNGFSSEKRPSEETLDGWPFMNPYQAREQSILSEFFRSQEQRNQDAEDDEQLMVASTAASISSSTYKDSTLLTETYEIEKAAEDASDVVQIDTIEENENVDEEDESSISIVVSSVVSESSGNISTEKVKPATTRSHDNPLASNDSSAANTESNSPLQKLPSTLVTARSPSPQAPTTPPPTLSPILLSLADLRDLKSRLSLTPERHKKAGKTKKARSYSSVTPSGSLPSSPTPNHENGLHTSWSRDDLRIASFRDDQIIKPKTRLPQPQRSLELQQTYRAAAVKSLAKPIASSRSTSLDFRSHVLSSVRREVPRDSCARSETAVDGQREEQQHWQSDFRRADEFDNRSATKDETTTITSALSHREPEELSNLREERNSYRDMCLTLGAEVAKLKAMLAAQQATAAVVPFEHQEPYDHPMYRPFSIDPQGMRPFFYGIKRGQRLGPMSDAGLHRAGDYESQVSEDDLFEPVPKARIELARQMSSSATAVGSDASVDFNNSNPALQGGPISIAPIYDSIPVQGLQSRLTKDILRFLDATRSQLRKQDRKRSTATERFSRLVTTVWPRAQVKLYGSHISGLCLPSSDLDIVVCLPAVHKNAPALAPGVLEGRNAINESSQRLLARELKGESWLDPRSIKLIERTVVPVIKVSTKDTRAGVIQLDISFDSPEHHGLQANEMVTQILDDLPLIRPLMLILKQFLLDRGLLTAYTGGVSSYCLFLMVARYLQEQPRSVGDCGSLLMGFLDFYGNHFDPRATGISVRRRQYFVRTNQYQPGSYTGQSALWAASIPHTPQHINVPSPSSAGPHDYLRRNSFSSETGSVDGGRRNQRPPRFQAGNSTTHRFIPHGTAVHPCANTDGNDGGSRNMGASNEDHNNPNSFGRGRPFTFDPLFVEDPLSSSNNVGRNAFRIFQVQRAFSDAHRALVASLEWDINSSGELGDGVEYPLLKCLLQSEDVFYEL